MAESKATAKLRQPDRANTSFGRAGCSCEFHYFWRRGRYLRNPIVRCRFWSQWLLDLRHVPWVL